MKKLLTVLLGILLLVSCGSSPGNVTAPRTRDFPMAEIPMMVTEPQERAAWLAEHFWDRFTVPDTLYFCDSLTINGVKKEDVEKQMGLFSQITESLPLEVGTRSMVIFFERLEAFQTAQPAGNVLPETVGLVTYYFYDPNSPVRSEDLYLPFVKKLSESALIDPAYRMRYQRDAKMCALNRTGTRAADFTFIDTNGKRRTLYGIRAERTLLIFGNPDCHACKELMEAMEAYPEISQQIASGKLQVADIYIDQDIDLWKERMASYPSTWINGYDPTFSIREDLIYNVRAVPSLYLLSADKTVLLKDALPEQVLDMLLR